jgi:biotin carboxyl carrier protein
MKIIEIKAPVMSVVSAINVQEHQIVNIGDLLLTLEVMKTQNNITSEYVGRVTEVLVEPDQLVEDQQVLLKIETND